VCACLFEVKRAADMCACVSLCVCMYESLRVCVYVCVCVCVHVYLCVRVYVCVCIHLYCECVRARESE